MLYGVLSNIAFLTDILYTQTINLINQVIIMPNHLIHETSPYLLQHAHNPVDWYPWGDEAFEKARREDKPIFLSIGYAACHWCHVMAHESFEDPDIAEILNRYFVPVKVDREERPDVDSIYMNAVITLTGQGGWPLSVFLTPEGKPFYGGTYFPPTPRHGLPSFRDVLLAALQSWENDREDLFKAGEQLSKHIRAMNDWGIAPGMVLRANLLEQVTHALLSSYDRRYGGWGNAPRFPQPMVLEFLLMQVTRGNVDALKPVEHNLQVMSRGGLYDIVGGGFARYSTDNDWLVPHFEKMLYDNAQLASVYLHAGILENHPWFLRTATQTLDFLLREMAHPLGGFFSSLDADSEGEEGKYYLWEYNELRQILEPVGLWDFFLQVFKASPEGNFEGKIILQARADWERLPELTGLSENAFQEKLDNLRKFLSQTRNLRIRPSVDDKIIVSWNGLALRAFAEAARYLNRNDYLEAAQRNAHFLLENLYTPKGLMRTWREGTPRQWALLEDYASLILGLLALYQSDDQVKWYEWAVRLADEMIARYRDPAGGFFDTRDDQKDLLLRPKDFQDNATPCGNSLAANALLMLYEFSGENSYYQLATQVLPLLQDSLVKYPTAFGFWLQAVDWTMGPARQIAILAPNNLDEVKLFKNVLWKTYRPRLVSAVSTFPPAEKCPALLHNRSVLDGKVTAYLCEGFVCHHPTSDVHIFREQLEPGDGD